MTPDQLYQYASVLIFLPWALLIAAPNWKHTERTAFISAILLLLAAAVCAWVYFRHADSSLLSLDGLTSLFRNREMLLAGWLNYLTFSLLVGIWQVHDAKTLRIPHILVVPCLFATMVAGPVGLLLYLLLRAVKTKKWLVGD